MWRVVLSIIAAAWNAIMLAVWLAILPGTLHPKPFALPPHAVPASPAVQHDTWLSAVIFVIFIGSGFALNMLAIAFGSRLRLPRRPDAGRS